MAQIAGQIRVVIAEDHGIVREGIRMLIEAEDDMTIVGEACDGDEAVRLAEKLTPDVILMDVGLPGTNGIVATRRIKRKFRAINVVALTRHDEEGYMRQLIEADASGFVLKQSPPTEMVKAVRAVAGGDQYLDPAVAAKILQGYSRSRSTPTPTGEAATQRESEVIRLVALGGSNKEIAERIDVSVKTVELDKASAMKKLGLADRVGVVRYAIAQGWMKET